MQISIETVIVYLRHLIQYGPGANRFRNDCGPACVGMWLAMLGDLGELTIDVLAAETGLRSSDTGLSAAALVELAGWHGIQSYVHTHTTLDQIKTELAAGRAPIALIAYRFISERQDQNDNVPGNDGHFVIVAGVSPDGVFLEDPDFWGSRAKEGHQLFVSLTELDKALAPYGGTCVFLKELPVLDKIIADASEITVLAQTVRDQVPPTPPPTVEPIPPGSVEATITNAQGANIRSSAEIPAAPNQLLNVVGGANSGDKLIVDPRTPKLMNGYHWLPITARTFKGNYVALEMTNLPH